MGNITSLISLYLTRMDRSACWNVSVHYGLSTARHHLGDPMDRLLVCGRCDFDFWVIYYEVVYIVVRNDVSHYFLVFLPS